VNDGGVTGDRINVAFPAHPAALRDGGVTFLTNAFHASGALGGQNRVALDFLLSFVRQRAGEGG